MISVITPANWPTLSIIYPLILSRCQSLRYWNIYLSALFATLPSYQPLRTPYKGLWENSGYLVIYLTLIARLKCWNLWISSAWWRVSRCKFCRSPLPHLYIQTHINKPSGITYFLILPAMPVLKVYPPCYSLYRKLQSLRYDNSCKKLVN